jgi:hypothetical protein
MEVQPSMEKSYGKNIELLLKIVRHGDRDPKTNMLTDYGRSETKVNANESGLNNDDFDIIHAVGSTVGPFDEKGMGRAEATAHIYAGEVAGKEDFNTRKTEVLAYDNLVNKVPYDHRAVYNSFLPENFNDLSSEEKGKAGIEAQGKLVDFVLALDTPEAREYKEEGAGSMAYLIKHYQDVAHRLGSGKKAFVPAGVHGTFMEFLFQKALIRKDADGNEIKGFNNLSEIGGQHNTSEAFSVKINTDQNGVNEPVTLIFDNPNRPASEMILDQDIVNELAKKYEELHPEIRGLRKKNENN